MSSNENKILEYSKEITMTKKEWDKFSFSIVNNLSNSEMLFLSYWVVDHKGKLPDKLKFPNGEEKELNWKCIRR